MANVKFDSNSRVSLSNSDSGDYNTVLGYQAGNLIGSGDNNNVFIGHLVADANMTDARDNVAIGYNAWTAGTTGDDNVIIGSGAAVLLTTGKENVVVGSGAYASANTSENYGVAIGFEAAKLLDGIDNVTAIGHSALSTMVAVDGNTAVGFEAGKVTTGGYNTYIGFKSGKGASGADANNTAVGNESLTAITDGAYNTVLGGEAGHDLTTGDENVFIGLNAGDKTTDVDKTVIIGANAGGADLTSGADGTIAIGYQALTALTTGGGNVAIGQHALSVETDANNCTAIGYQALQQQANDSTASVFNTAVGFQAGRLGTTHINSVYVGYLAGGEATLTGQSNVLIGSESGKSFTSANENVAIGFHSQRLHTTGDYNTTLGAKTMQDTNAHSNIQDSSHNTFLGWNSGGGTWSGSTACSYNTGVGSEALENSLDGAGYNVAVGWRAGDAVVDGDKNTIVGAEADPSTGGAENQTAIGYGAQAQADNSVTLGNASVTAVYAAQDSGAVVYCSGINFPDDASANHSGDVNTLDNYEEGTWSASLNNTTETLEVSTGYYVKIGSQVTVTWYSGSITSLGSTGGSAQIAGLPFTVKSTSNSHSSLVTVAFNTVASNADGGYFGTNGTTITLVQEGSTTNATYGASSGNLMVSGTYFTH